MFFLIASFFIDSDFYLTYLEIMKQLLFNLIIFYFVFCIDCAVIII